jgi:alcohol dehydrogenase class IV
VCDLHHGLANALMIDTVLAWNYEAVPAKFDELAHVCKVAGGGAAFVPWLKSLKASVGITGTLASTASSRSRFRGWSRLPSTTSATRPIRGPARRGLRAPVQGGDVEGWTA